MTELIHYTVYEHSDNYVIFLDGELQSRVECADKNVGYVDKWILIGTKFKLQRFWGKVEIKELR